MVRKKYARHTSLRRRGADPGGAGGGDDFAALWEEGGETDPCFADLVEESLAAGELQQVLKEKAHDAGRETKKRPSRSAKTPVEAELDLHGCRAEEAAARTRFFLDRARANRKLVVRLITGRGTHSPAGIAVLPGVVSETLEELRLAGRVVDYRWEKQSGAVLVRLPVGRR